MTVTLEILTDEERRLAVEHWLLAAAEDPLAARGLIAAPRASGDAGSPSSAGALPRFRRGGPGRAGAMRMRPDGPGGQFFYVLVLAVLIASLVAGFGR
ncbi:hypothetical protein [Streptomyces shenzhenensis]|uniref:Uncharacterized protein n=1 Tax=Streptomyces shenzhenensis TaxID=943815 RepID=A0A3M0ICU2_9ACTN|nr:hypothetical protein [Streptomyces shenzhenensis]RMB84603.1 hypothetical protein CTZ28_17935 [Streptomyces shenzhenensis]